MTDVEILMTGLCVKKISIVTCVSGFRGEYRLSHSDPILTAVKTFSSFICGRSVSNIC